jgi:hypothetical protein
VVGGMLERRPSADAQPVVRSEREADHRQTGQVGR